MIEIKKATLDDAAKLTEIHSRTFQDDNKLEPPGRSMEWASPFLVEDQLGRKISSSAGLRNLCGNQQRHLGPAGRGFQSCFRT